MKHIFKSQFKSKIFFIGLLFLSHGAFGLQSFESSETQTPLLELYYSQGCSSCPPAQAWISKQKTNQKLWKDIVPVVFHVHYWDYLGWKDLFGSPRYTDRQRKLANESGARLYTPGFFVDGKEWRGWFNKTGLPNKSSAKVGILKLNINKRGKGEAFFSPTGKGKNWRVNIVLLGFEIQTDVSKGENAGEKLPHDFTVLNFETLPLSAKKRAYHAPFSLALTHSATKKLGIAAWVSNKTSEKPRQAVGGFLN